MGSAAGSVETGNSALVLNESNNKFANMGILSLFKRCVAFQPVGANFYKPDFAPLGFISLIFLMGGMIALGLTTMTGVFAGILTARSSHKKYKQKYEKKMRQSAAVMENPYVLAFKALGWGTVWAVGGVSLITFCGCLLLGIRNMDDLRAKIRKNRGPVDTATNFETFQDFYDYLVTESKKSKTKKTDELEKKS